MFVAVPAAPPAPAVPPPPFRVSVSFWVWSGVPLFAYVSFCSVVRSAFRSAFTCTCALPGPSVCTSIAFRFDSMLCA